MLDAAQVHKDKAPKAKWNYLQKYWHKGAYFQESADDTRGTAGTDGIFARDFSAPTGMDKFDKSLLPKVMQVRAQQEAGRGAAVTCSLSKTRGVGGGCAASRCAPGPLPPPHGRSRTSAAAGAPSTRTCWTRTPPT